MMEVQTRLRENPPIVAYRRYCLRCRIKYTIDDDTLTCPVCERNAVIDLSGAHYPRTYSWRREAQTRLTDEHKLPVYHP